MNLRIKPIIFYPIKIDDPIKIEDPIKIHKKRKRRKRICKLLFSDWIIIDIPMIETGKYF